MKPNGWLRSAKWTGAVCSFLLALNLVATVLLANVPLTAVVTSLAVAALFVVCGVGYLTESKWVLKFTLVLVLVVYIGAGVYWLQTGQFIGLLPVILLLLLLFVRGKLESSLKAQQHASPNGGPVTLPPIPKATDGPPSLS